MFVARPKNAPQGIRAKRACMNCPMQLATFVASHRCLGTSWLTLTRLLCICRTRGAHWELLELRGPRLGEIGLFGKWQITTEKIYGHPRVNPARSLKTVNAAPLCNAKGLQSSACTKQFQRERTKHSLSNGAPLHFPQGMRSRSCPDPASGWRTNRRRRKCSPETRPSSCQ